MKEDSKIMSIPNKKRLPDVKSLYDILPKGAEGGKEFGRIVDLLLFHEARREGKKLSIFSDSAGDYFGLDSFEGDSFRKEGTTGYQYKFFPSPLSAAHRAEIKKSLERTIKNQAKLKLKKWILVTPQDLTESAVRRDLGDVTWFEGLRDALNVKFELEHWGHRKLQSLFLQTSYLCLFYYPELASNSNIRRTIEDSRKRYDDNLSAMYSNIEFVGMSVYKQEATRGVPMEHIYIPLTVVTEQGADDSERTNPLRFLQPATNQVILGDPGSGKSTLLRFLALVGNSRPLQTRCEARPDNRLPVLVILRRYADELKTRHNLSLLNYIVESVQADFNLNSADTSFFEFYLESGQAILLFDGLDELPSSGFKQTIRNRINSLVTTYPGNSVIVSSRIVGYESKLRFDEKRFGHFRLTRLQLSEMERFVNDWYAARIENPKERDANAEDLVRILQSDEQSAIRELAENPLLLTIVALVHRIDAVLPDERVVLYSKCTETLLNTWHTWKYRNDDPTNRGKEERRNRRRMEAIAYWMHRRSGGSGRHQRAVVPLQDLHRFLSKHILDAEAPYDPQNDPEDIASEFIEFVKKKAGLLIEVGDEQYSFVHQTFQEYLTASHIITTNEANGLPGIWRDIKSTCNDPRWVEVIRLLIAALQSNRGQQFLLNKILNFKIKGPSIVKAQLLGGIFLDGIEPAQLEGNKIVAQLFHSANTTVDSNDLRPLLSRLSSCGERGCLDFGAIKDTVRVSFQKSRTQREKMALVLNAITLNWATIDDVESLVDIKKTKEKQLLRLFVQNGDADLGSFQLEFERLWHVQDRLRFNSAFGNIGASCLQALTFSLPESIVWEQFLRFSILGLPEYDRRGPFEHFVLNTLFLAGVDQSHQNLLAGNPARFIDRKELLSDQSSRLPRTLSKLGIRRFTQFRKVATIGLDDKTIERSIYDFERVGPRNLGHSIASDIYADDREWSDILSSDVSQVIVRCLCQCFDLEPLAQWQELIRSRFLPSIPERLGRFDQKELRRLEGVFRNGNYKEADVFIAGWFLLFDILLYLCTVYQSPHESKVYRLSELTSNLDAIPLRISHCIRSIAFGESSRQDELEYLLKSPESGFLPRLPL
jgi:hypothetical protein